MIAFTRDFHVLTSRVPTGISAVLLARRNLAETWDARTFRRLLIDHLKSPLKVPCESLITEFGRTSLLHASLQIRDRSGQGSVRSLDELGRSQSLSRCPINQTSVGMLDVLGRPALIEPSLDEYQIASTLHLLAFWGTERLWDFGNASAVCLQVKEIHI